MAISNLVSVISLVVIIWLMMMEMMYYLETSFTYTFIPDTDFSEKLKINVDITVAMPCRCGYCNLCCLEGKKRIRVLIIVFLHLRKNNSH